MEDADVPADMAIDAEQQRLDAEFAANVQEQLDAEIATQHAEQQTAAEEAEAFFDSPDQAEAPSDAETETAADEPPLQPTDHLDLFLAQSGLHDDNDGTPAPQLGDYEPAFQIATGNTVDNGIDAHGQQSEHQHIPLHESEPLSNSNNGNGKQKLPESHTDAQTQPRQSLVDDSQRLFNTPGKNPLEVFSSGNKVQDGITSPIKPLVLPSHTDAELRAGPGLDVRSKIYLTGKEIDAKCTAENKHPIRVFDHIPKDLQSVGVKFSVEKLSPPKLETLDVREGFKPNQYWRKLYSWFQSVNCLTFLFSILFGNLVILKDENPKSDPGFGGLVLSSISAEGMDLVARLSQMFILEGASYLTAMYAKFVQTHEKVILVATLQEVVHHNRAVLTRFMMSVSDKVQAEFITRSRCVSIIEVLVLLHNALFTGYTVLQVTEIARKMFMEAHKPKNMTVRAWLSEFIDRHEEYQHVLEHPLPDATLIEVLFNSISDVPGAKDLQSLLELTSVVTIQPVINAIWKKYQKQRGTLGAPSTEDICTVLSDTVIDKPKVKSGAKTGVKMKGKDVPVAVLDEVTKVLKNHLGYGNKWTGGRGGNKGSKGNSQGGRGSGKGQSRYPGPTQEKGGKGASRGNAKGGKGKGAKSKGKFDSKQKCSNCGKTNHATKDCFAPGGAKHKGSHTSKADMHANTANSDQHEQNAAKMISSVLSKLHEAHKPSEGNTKSKKKTHQRVCITKHTIAHDAHIDDEALQSEISMLSISAHTRPNTLTDWGSAETPQDHTPPGMYRSYPQYTPPEDRWLRNMDQLIPHAMDSVSSTTSPRTGNTYVNTEQCCSVCHKHWTSCECPDKSVQLTMLSPPSGQQQTRTYTVPKPATPMQDSPMCGQQPSSFSSDAQASSQHAESAHRYAINPGCMYGAQSPVSDNLVFDDGITKILVDGCATGNTLKEKPAGAHYSQVVKATVVGVHDDEVEAEGAIVGVCTYNTVCMSRNTGHAPYTLELEDMTHHSKSKFSTFAPSAWSRSTGGLYLSNMQGGFLILPQVDFQGKTLILPLYRDSEYGFDWIVPFITEEMIARTERAINVYTSFNGLGSMFGRFVGPGVYGQPQTEKQRETMETRRRLALQGARPPPFGELGELAVALTQKKFGYPRIHANNRAYGFIDLHEHVAAIYDHLLATADTVSYAVEWHGHKYSANLCTTRDQQFPKSTLESVIIDFGLSNGKWGTLEIDATTPAIYPTPDMKDEFVGMVPYSTDESALDAKSITSSMLSSDYSTVCIPIGNTQLRCLVTGARSCEHITCWFQPQSMYVQKHESNGSSTGCTWDSDQPIYSEDAMELTGGDTKDFEIDSSGMVQHKPSKNMDGPGGAGGQICTKCGTNPCSCQTTECLNVLGLTLAHVDGHRRLMPRSQRICLYEDCANTVDNICGIDPHYCCYAHRFKGLLQLSCGTCDEQKRAAQISAAVDVKPHDSVYCPSCRTDGCQCEVFEMYAYATTFHPPSEGTFDPSSPRFLIFPWYVLDPNRPTVREKYETGWYAKFGKDGTNYETAIDFDSITEFKIGVDLYEGWIVFHKTYYKYGAVTTEISGALPIRTKHGVLHITKISQDERCNFYYTPRGRDLYYNASSCMNTDLTVVETPDEYEIIQTFVSEDPVTGKPMTHNITTDLFSKIDGAQAHTIISMIPYQKGPSLMPDKDQKMLDLIEKKTAVHPIYDPWTKQNALDTIHVRSHSGGVKQKTGGMRTTSEYSTGKRYPPETILHCQSISMTRRTR